jgi:hypothetical protein
MGMTHRQLQQQQLLELGVNPTTLDHVPNLLEPPDMPHVVLHLIV